MGYFESKQIVMRCGVPQGLALVPLLLKVMLPKTIELLLLTLSLNSRPTST